MAIQDLTDTELSRLFIDTGIDLSTLPAIATARELASPRPGPCGECRTVPCRCENPQQTPPSSESQVERHTKFAALKANLVPPSPDEKDNGHARPKAHDRCGAV